MSNEDIIKYKQMLKNVPKFDTIPTFNKILQVENKLKFFSIFGVIGLFTSAFIYKSVTDMVPSLTNPTTKKFLAIPDLTSKKVQVFYRQVPNKAHEY